jgi:hypothetical protein
MPLALLVDLGNPSAAQVQALLEGLATVNRVAMRESGKRWPSLKEAGVRYQRTREWRSARRLLATKRGDCKDLVAYEVARLRELGCPVTIRLTRIGSLWHTLIRLPDGRLFDPSVELGMRPYRL